MQDLQKTDHETFEEMLDHNLGLYYFLVNLNTKKYKYKLGQYSTDEEWKQNILIAMWRAWESQRKYVRENKEIPCKFSTMVKVYVKDIVNNFTKYPNDIVYDNSINEKYMEETDFETEDFKNRFLEILTQEQREVFQYRFEEELTLQESADKMGISLQEVGLIENRVRDRFKEFYEIRLEKSPL